MKSFLLCALCLCFAKPAHAADSIRLWGKALNWDSTAGIREVAVTLFETGQTASTDSLGLYQFDSLPCGGYLVVFQKTGYFAATCFRRLDSSASVEVTERLLKVADYNLDSFTQVITVDTFIVLDTATIGAYHFGAVVPQFKYFNFKHVTIEELLKNPMQDFLDRSRPKTYDETVSWFTVMMTSDTALLKPRYIINASFRYVYMEGDPWCCLQLMDSSTAMEFVQYTPVFLQLQEKAIAILGRESLYQHFQKP